MRREISAPGPGHPVRGWGVWIALSAALAALPLEAAATSTSTRTAQASRTATFTGTSTACATTTGTETPTASASATPTGTASRTASASVTPTATVSWTATASPTDSHSATESVTATVSTTATPSGTDTGTATSTASASRTATSSETPTGSATPSRTATRTSSATASITLTPILSFTNSQTFTATAIPTPTPLPPTRSQFFVYDPSNSGQQLISVFNISNQVSCVTFNLYYGCSGTGICNAPGAQCNGALWSPSSGCSTSPISKSLTLQPYQTLSFDPTSGSQFPNWGLPFGTYGVAMFSTRGTSILAAAHKIQLTGVSTGSIHPQGALVNDAWWGMWVDGGGNVNTCGSCDHFYIFNPNPVSAGNPTPQAGCGPFGTGSGPVHVDAYASNGTLLDQWDLYVPPFGTVGVYPQQRTAIGQTNQNVTFHLTSPLGVAVNVYTYAGSGWNGSAYGSHGQFSDGFVPFPSQNNGANLIWEQVQNSGNIKAPRITNPNSTTVTGTLSVWDDAGWSGTAAFSVPSYGTIEPAQPAGILGATGTHFFYQLAATANLAAHAVYNDEIVTPEVTSAGQTSFWWGLPLSGTGGAGQSGAGVFNPNTVAMQVTPIAYYYVGATLTSQVGTLPSLAPRQAIRALYSATFPGIPGGVDDLTLFYSATLPFGVLVEGPNGADAEPLIGGDVYQTYSVIVDPDGGGTTIPGGTFCCCHTVSNAGGIADTYNLTATSAQGWPVSFYLDSGSCQPTGTPITAVGPIAAGAAAGIVACVAVPSTGGGLTDTVTVFATSQTVGNVYDSAICTVSVLNTSATPTRSGTRTASATPTGSASASATASATGTRTQSGTSTVSASATATPSGSITGTPTESATATESPLLSFTATATPTSSASPSVSGTATVSPTPTVSGTATVSGTVSASATASATPGMAAPFCDFFEPPHPAWNATGLWHLVDTASANPCALAFSSSRAFYFGLDASNGGSGSSLCTYDSGTAVSGRLESPAVQLPGSPSSLFFHSWYETEDPTSGWDVRRIEVSVNGAAWVPLATVSGDPIAAWTGLVYSLAPYAGQSIRVGFAFDSVDAYDNAFRGWYVDDVCIALVPSPTATSTRTFTNSPTPTSTASATVTATDTVTATPSETATATETSIFTLTHTATPSTSATATETATVTASASDTATATETATETETPTATPTETATQSATSTATPSSSETETATATNTVTATETPTSTATPSSTATETATPTESATPTETATPTSTVTDTETTTATSSATATETSSATATSTGTRSPTWTATRTASASFTVTVTPTATATVSQTPRPDRVLGLFPNPMPYGRGWVAYYLSGSADAISIVVYGADWRRVAEITKLPTGPLSNHVEPIDLSRLAPGTYLAVAIVRVGGKSERWPPVRLVIPR